jgi:hypothetical protein
MPSALVEGLLLLPQPPSESEQALSNEGRGEPEEADRAEMAAAKAEDDRSEPG